MTFSNASRWLLAAFLLVTLLYLAAIEIYARPEDAAEKRIAGLLEAKYRSARTMQATFLERYSENGRTVRVEAGVAYFRRPGKMRWEYESPEKNLFLVDGKTAWFYVPADHTVTRVPAKESGDWRTPLSLLAGEAKLSRVCERVQLSMIVPAESKDDAMLYCLPRGEEPRHSVRHQGDSSPLDAGQRDAIFLEIARYSGELVRVLARGKGGVEVEFRFAQWRMDPPVSDSMFRFNTPPGVAIVNGELPDGDEIVKP
jgi:outer membrane lipoprotein carrier protein